MFNELINYIEAQMNCETVVESGRFRRVLYANGLATCEVEYWDKKPVSVRRGREVVYSSGQREVNGKRTCNR